MRTRIPARFVTLSAYFVVTTSLVHAQAPQAGAPAAPAGGRAGQMQLSSPTPLTEMENLDVYPAAPEGFNVARENIPHGDVKIVEYESKTLGLRRMRRVYTPPGYTPDRKYPVLYLQHGLSNTSNRDNLFRVSKGVHDYLAEKGVPHIWRVDTNGHDTGEMSDSLYHFAQKLFQQ
jgi:predicted peptidase